MKYRLNSNILKLYASAFLMGLVFWYGIEKLFMGSIGIDPRGVGIATAVFLFFSFVLDIPSGIIADRWSRKGVLAVGAASLGLSSIIFGASQGLHTYLIGEVLYALYFVATSGTYQALIYDLLHEEGRSKEYSKVAGRTLALFFLSAAITSGLGGIIAAKLGIATPFFMTVIPCVLNVLILVSIKEPTFHKAEQQEKVLVQLKSIVGTLKDVASVRVLTVVLSALAFVEVFKSEFGQLYLLHYFSRPEALGILWAIYSLTWSIGSFFAHHFASRIGFLLLLTIIPYVFMAVADTAFAVGLFMLQAAAMAALTNRIETIVQKETPSSLRAAVLSVLSSLGKIVSIPASFVLGWIIYTTNVISAVQWVASIALLVGLYWAFRKKSLYIPSD